MKMPFFQKSAMPSWRDRSPCVCASRKHGAQNTVRGSKPMGMGSTSKARSRIRSHEMVSQWIHQVNPTEMQEMQEAFKFFDGNNDGKITAEELSLALKKLGDNPTEEEVMQMMKEADENGDGVISFEEFLSLQSTAGSKSRQEEIFQANVKQAFLRFDVNKDGLISAEELQGVMGRLGRPRSLLDCRRMISCVDLDHDGYVNFHEFLSMMKE